MKPLILAGLLFLLSPVTLIAQENRPQGGQQGNNQNAGKPTTSRIVLLLDRSQSMMHAIKLFQERRGKKGKIIRKPIGKTTNKARMLNALDLYLKQLRKSPGTEMTSIAFASKSMKLLGERFTPDPKVIWNNTGIFAKSAPYDTRIWTASDIGLDMLIKARKPQQKTVDHLIIFSDGVPEKERSTVNAVIKKAKENSIHVHVVLFLGNKELEINNNKPNLLKLTTETKGASVAVSNDAEIPVAIQLLHNKVSSIK